MPSNTPSERVRIRVIASDSATEIFLIDHAFDRIAQGVGKLSALVLPGIYKIRYRAGTTARDELVEVTPTPKVQEFRHDPVEFRSAVPLSNRSLTPKYQSDPAMRLSRETHARLGNGAELFIFVRDPKEGGLARPGDFVSLRDLTGNLVFDMKAAQCDQSERWAGVNLEVDPGTYRLRVESSTLGSYEIFLVAAPNWQTRAFLIVDDIVEGKERVRRPRLLSASVSMSERGFGFSPENPTERLTELALRGLEGGRSVIAPRVLREMLASKFEDPMLGILGAHVEAQKPAPDRNLIVAVCKRLREMIGDHPDVRALELQAAKKRSGPPARAFASPPMLYSSWQLIARATQEFPDLVPTGSLTDRVSDGIVPRGPWLLWRVPDESTLAAPSATPQTFDPASTNQLLERLRAISSDGLDRWLRTDDRYRKVSGLEQSVLRALEGFAQFAESKLASGTADKVPTKRKPVDIGSIERKLAAQLRVPVRSIERAGANLAAYVGSLGDKDKA